MERGKGRGRTPFGVSDQPAHPLTLSTSWVQIVHHHPSILCIRNNTPTPSTSWLHKAYNPPHCAQIFAAGVQQFRREPLRHASPHPQSTAVINLKRSLNCEGSPRPEGIRKAAPAGPNPNETLGRQIFSVFNRLYRYRYRYGICIVLSNF